MKEFLEILRTKNEILYYFGLICFVAALICLILTRTHHVQVMNINAWFKPFKFFLSTAIFVWTIAWFLQYLPEQEAVRYYSWGMVFLFTIEDLYIAVQAYRGELSHFNVSAPLYSNLYVLMAVAAIGISLWTGVMGVYFFKNNFPQLENYYLWAIRLSLIIFVIYSMEGMVMGSRLAHSVGGADGSEGLPVVNWSKSLGDLRIAHFMGMHALQIIPLLAYFLLKNTTAVVITSLLYLTLNTAVFVQALMGKPLIKG